MRVAQAVGVVGVAFEQLGAGGADHEQRDRLGPVGEVLQEREHRVVGPVQVLEHEHGGVAARRCARGTVATR